jgi:uncharacterized Zn finger protein
MIQSLVQGSASEPYKIKITIEELEKKIWENIKKTCRGKLESLQEFLDGKFPKALAEFFKNRETGLFPSPSEINFKCSCPDSAAMCKHIAATLYGVAVRLDEEPALFFTLRNVEIQELISKAIEAEKKDMLKKAKKKTSRIIEDSNLGELFGIDMEGSAPEKKSEKISGKKKSPQPAKDAEKKGKGRQSKKAETAKIKTKKATDKKATDSSKTKKASRGKNEK